MRIIIISLIFLIISVFAYSQDKIITQRGDTLNCKITKVLDDYIYYSIEENKENRRSIIPMSDVQYYVMASDNKSDKESGKKEKKDFNAANLQLGVNYGGAYRTGKINGYEGFEEHYKKMKWGTYFCGSLTYYFNDINGAGLKYSRLSSKHEGAGETLDTIGSMRRGNITDKVKISFMGIYYSLRFVKEAHCIFFNPGVGKVYYKNDFSFKSAEDTYSENVYFSGSALGFCVDLGYDYRFTDYLSVGVKASYYIANIRNMKHSGKSMLPRELVPPSENIQNLNISLGVKLLIGW
jgi:hypothetical protein